MNQDVSLCWLVIPTLIGGIALATYLSNGSELKGQLPPGLGGPFGAIGAMGAAGDPDDPVACPVTDPFPSCLAADCAAPTSLCACYSVGNTSADGMPDECCECLAGAPPTDYCPEGYRNENGECCCMGPEITIPCGTGTVTCNDSCGVPGITFVCPENVGCEGACNLPPPEDPSPGPGPGPGPGGPAPGNSSSSTSPPLACSFPSCVGDERCCAAYDRCCEPECPEGTTEKPCNECPVMRICPPSGKICCPDLPESDTGGNGDNGSSGGNGGNGGGSTGSATSTGSSLSSSSSGSSVSSSSSSKSSSAGPLCGNRIIDPDEECDPTAPPPVVCGDKLATGNEECDDGNILNGDGCSSVCVFESESFRAASRCGDDIVVPEEECDDGNILNGDGCSSTCKDTDPSDDPFWTHGCKEDQACTGACTCKDLYDSSSSSPREFCCIAGQCTQLVTCDGSFVFKSACELYCGTSSTSSISLVSSAVSEASEESDTSSIASTASEGTSRSPDSPQASVGSTDSEGSDTSSEASQARALSSKVSLANLPSSIPRGFVLQSSQASSVDNDDDGDGDNDDGSPRNQDDDDDQNGDNDDGPDNDDDGDGDNDDGSPRNQDDDDDGDGDNDDGTPNNQDDDDGNGDNDDDIPNNAKDEKGCNTTEDCSIGICKNGNCIPCINDGECTAGSCNNGLCSGPSLISAAYVCGNGVLEGNEECDDSNARDNDGCSSVCLMEVGICGDGIIQSLLGEQCEQSVHNSALPYKCTSNCRFLSLFCGDGKLDPGEECDEGPLNSTSPSALCRPDCGSARCGDGIIDVTELCDDGNRLNGDSCDRFCLIPTEETKVLVEKFATTNVTYDPRSYPTPNLPFQYQLQGMQFPQYPNFQQLPYQLPLAQLQPLIATQGPVGDTGPAAVAVIGAGAAAGLSWMRRKRK